MTPHISAKKEEISSVVLMPGDPLRAKFIAENYLKDYKLVNTIRNMYIYTGTYMDKKVTVAGSGMGMASIGIYSYELYKFYDVKTIIRIGSAGSYDARIKINDVINVASCYSESTFAKVAFNITDNILLPSKKIYDVIESISKQLWVPVKHGRIHSSDVFYHNQDNYWKKVHQEYQALCVEMESFALFANAKSLNKNAACLLTISDSLVTGESTTAEQREKSFNNMMKLALETAYIL